jgi:RHS repeat-associated protein
MGLAYAVSGSAVEVYHADGLGSTRWITDAAGATTDRYRTDEFGIPSWTEGPSTQPFRFTGEPRDGTGLTYLRARYYDPSLGRFMSRDSLVGFSTSPQSLNQYVYVANNPATSVDPSGRCFMMVPGAILAGGAGGSVVPVAGTAAGAALVGFAATLACVAILASQIIDTKEGGVVPQPKTNWEQQIHKWEPPVPEWEPGKGPIGPKGPGPHIPWKAITGAIVGALLAKSLILHGPRQSPR